MHEIIFDHEEGNDAVFKCIKCNAPIGFNKEGIGDPSAKFVDGVWVAPENYNDWMSPCEA
jgi:hypothetical protein